jgi:hypothetical protein
MHLCHAAVAMVAIVETPAAIAVTPAIRRYSDSSPALLLLQTHAQVRSPVNASNDDALGNRGTHHAKCAELENHGAYFTVRLEAGTPRQRFDVVADTGSDAVIIPSCICRQDGDCPKADRCFHGTGKSKSFFITKQNVSLIDMEFGSGSIKAAISTDVVSVGGAVAKMDDGLLLMVGRQLDITGPFEGILGLGQLQSEYSPQLENASDGVRAGWDRPSAETSTNSTTISDDDVYIPGFLRQANIDTFSMCFNDGSQPGTLRFGVPQQEGIPSVGTLHWALDFRGFSVGSESVQALFCGTEETRSNNILSRFTNFGVGGDWGRRHQECGAIPDSGTTIMMGPELQVQRLFSGICDEWPRCAKAYRTGVHARKPKHHVFQLLLAQCEDWLQEGNGLEELPSLYLHLGGPERNKTLELSAWSYVFETPVAEMEAHTKLLGGVGVSFASTNATENRASGQYACAPAFGASSYSAYSDSLVWILGTPLFYEYVVTYNRGKSSPEVSFSNEQCGNCGTDAPRVKSKLALVSQNHRDHTAARRFPRRVQGPLRVGHHWRHRQRKGRQSHTTQNTIDGLA